MILNPPKGVIYHDPRHWGSPWVAQPNTNIHDLIDQGYKVVDTDVEFVAVTGGIFEAIYLMKDGQLYRCVTGQRKDTVVHGCEMCVARKKRE